MKVHNNFQEHQRVNLPFTKLLVESLGMEPGEIVLISPWIKDVELPVSRVGNWSARLGNSDTILLSTLLVELSRIHKVKVIIKPVHELMNLYALAILPNKLEIRNGFIKAKEHQQIDAYLADIVYKEVTKDIQMIIDDTCRHRDTIEFGWNLSSQGCEVKYVEKLHAKLLCTPAGCLVGSANFTNGGLLSNMECMLEFHDSGSRQLLGDEAMTYLKNAVTTQEYAKKIKFKLQKHDLSIELFKQFINGPELQDYSEFREFLERVIG